MPALLHLNALGPLIAQDLEHGWALLGSTLLLRADYFGPVPMPIPSTGRCLRTQTGAWPEVEAHCGVELNPTGTKVSNPPNDRLAGQGREPPVWLSPACAAQHLGLSRAAVERLRKLTPGSLPGAPVNQSSGGQRARWRWRRSSLETWIEEVGKWQASKNEAKDTACAGETQTAHRAAANARTKTRPSASGGTSRKQAQKGGDGSLVMLVRSLNSTR